MLCYFSRFCTAGTFTLTSTSMAKSQSHAVAPLWPSFIILATSKSPAWEPVVYWCTTYALVMNSDISSATFPSRCVLCKILSSNLNSLKRPKTNWAIETPRLNIQDSALISVLVRQAWHKYGLHSNNADTPARSSKYVMWGVCFKEVDAINPELITSLLSIDHKSSSVHPTSCAQF